jgi:DNA-binding MarR family transcriptional regulator
MDTNELKFLLKLLGCPNYRSSLSASGFNSFKGKEKLCRDLGDRDLVDYSREIATVKILPPGRALLKMSTEQLPITDKELKVLEKIGKSSGKTAPSQITVSSLKAPEREAILESLGERGVIEVEKKLKRTKAEVWLTERGIEYLQNDYTPKGAATINLDLLNNYLRFLRKSLALKPDPVPPQPPTNGEPPIEPIGDLSDEEILQTIQKLDRELGTGNYLPIFHLRQKLEPPLSRENLDQALYRLEKADRIELSTLAEPRDYTPEQVDAGISQVSGGSLFFIAVN